ncbi:hypothetical protein [Enterobacter phage 04_vB_Eclo_IJM]|nr:hypothetical protein [Enterobacter phage 04_vB_Eclo_IJM]
MGDSCLTLGFKLGWMPQVLNSAVWEPSVSVRWW